MSTADKRQTIQNYKSDILEARVIANYGDPGLDEDYHFDILSRYIIVMIESCQRVVTSDKYAQMIALVQRPKQLWISTSSQPDGNPANQKRSDDLGNVNVGVAGGFSVNAIPRIYPAYSFGEVIKIRRIKQPLQPPADSMFLSAFTDWSSTWGYGGWHSEGSTLPYFTTDAMKTQLRQKTITPVSGYAGYYMGILFKMQYEAFALTLNLSNSTISQGLTTLFNGTWPYNPAVYSANGGYVFSNDTDRVYLNYAGFEDINAGQKARVTTNECIPMVVTTPNSFPLPSSRAIGSIGYNPTYSPISY